MPPITIHNLPVPPREVQLAFDEFNRYLLSCHVSNAVENNSGVEMPVPHFNPTELDYCAILLDTGHQSWGHRHMVIECSDDGYSWIMHAVMQNEEIVSLSYCGDDDDKIVVTD